MTGDSIVEAIVLGTVEGMTEFLPVSSTGHLLLLGHFLGLGGEGDSFKTFVVLIQLGAILAILSVYFQRLWSIAVAIPTDPAARRFVLGVLLAFLPAMVIGAGLHGFIKQVLFETPAVICVSLILGGLVLLWVDSRVKAPIYTDATTYPMALYLKIGLCQCIAMIPGVSRSGATIAGSLLMGTDKRSAAEFSFFLAMPTMAGAFAYDLYKSRNILTFDDVGFIAIGFAAAFVAGVIVVKSFLGIVTRYGFAPFAWWRIAVGTLGLIGLYFGVQGHMPARAELTPPAVTAHTSGELAVKLPMRPEAPQIGGQDRRESARASHPETFEGATLRLRSL
jgi:undecaprenyl-diphosphatase